MKKDEEKEIKLHRGSVCCFNDSDICIPGLCGSGGGRRRQSCGPAGKPGAGSGV